ncbi:MAG: AAA family ATPase [Pseudobdellovibrionaceae bacterium]|nr:AAA family ATPase [Pseudobdellovibrionaceae bacterium]
MEYTEIIEKMSIIQARITSALRPISRPYLKGIDLQKQRTSLITGPRGVGKTSFLLRESQKNGNMLYISADHPLVSTLSLWELGERAFLSGYSGLIVDEVHFAADWSAHLKSLYDSFPDKFIWASDSSSLVLRLGTHDLSRRFPTQYVPFLSLREYIALKGQQELKAFDPLRAEAAAFEEALSTGSILAHFRDYLREGFRPIFLEDQYQSRILSVIEKTIMADIPFFVSGVHDNHLRLMRAIMGYLATTHIPTLNIESLSKEWGVGKEKLYSLLSVMDEVGLITIVRLKSDHKAAGKGAKIFFADPTMYAALSGDLGNVREAFVVAAFKQAGKTVYAADKEVDGDLVIDGMLVEVGGKQKKRKKADFVIRDDSERPIGNGIPLWSLGMMY